MTRTYDAAGKLLTEEQVKDDGMTIDKTFGQREIATVGAGGVAGTKTINFATQVVTTDTDTVHETSAHLGLKTWDSITTNYGSDGLVSASTTVMDDTDTVVRTYAGGVLSQVVKTDVNDDSTNETVTATYNASGKIVTSEVLRDDDVTVTFDYDADGKVIQTLTVDTTDTASPETTSETDKVDGEYAWKSVGKTIADGNVVSQTVVYDDDRSVTSVYDDTVIGDVIMTVTQTQTGAVLAGEFWTDKVTTYVAGDAITPRFVESSVTTTNLGRVTVIENGNDGVRDSMLVTDEGAGTTGAFNWDSIATHYNASGDMVSRLQVQDSGDQALRLYDDAGKLTDVVLYDGDNSNNWEFRVTTYDAAGAPSTSLADASTLPAEYTDYFSAVPVMSVV
ncbi:hypothetical protein ACOI1H_24590 [Loktanella sp. DJP18]|uniref:hypothetical protein n=1 Tax=Loktanella sp. DJP18 TaxID=3409788 RepID=UPI003BB771B6